MEIEIIGFVKKKYKDLVKNVASKTNEIMNQPDNLSVSIAFVSKHKIRKLNRTLRQIDRVTDVLSFPSTDLKAGEKLNLSLNTLQFLIDESGNVHFGDIAICLPKIKMQAKEYHKTVSQELKTIVIHSMLHLMGYDHIKDNDYELMHKNEIFIDKIIEVKG